MNTLLQLTNEVSIGDDGWAQIAPFGDYPGVAFTSLGRRPAVQRIDAQTGETLRSSLKSLTGRASRFFRSVPIYNGHPDVPQISDRYPDKEAKGHIADLAVRADGIYIRPVFSNAGETLLNGDRRLGFSAYVDAEVLCESDGNLVTRWTGLRSLGLTDRPNLPVELVNESESTMNPKLIAALALAGITLANEATEAQILDAVGNLQRQRDTAVALANTRATEASTAATERDQAKSDLATERTTLANERLALANERAARITEVLDHAVESGRIADADRAIWKPRLEANFANEAPQLAKLTATWKVATQMANEGDRTGSGRTAQGLTKVELCNAKVREIQDANPTMDYRDAYLRAAQLHPTLFN